MESPPRSPPQNSTPALGSSEKLPAQELRRSSCNHEGSNSGQTSELEPQAVDQQARKIQAILDFEFLIFDLSSTAKEDEIVSRIVIGHANKLFQELDPGSERRKLQEDMDGLTHWTSEVDRSRDLPVMHEFYKKYREAYHIDWVEGRLRKQEGSTDQLPDMNKYTSV